MNSLQDQVALVTGAGSGVGKAIVLALARRRVTLCLAGRSRSSLETVMELAQREGARSFCFPVDLTEDQGLRRLPMEMEREAGGVDMLIHSAGVVSIGRIEEAPVTELDRQFMTNVRGPYVLTQALLPTLRARRGQVVFINSTAGLTAPAGSSQYAAAKHALKGLADSLREEVNPYGIRVLSVYLGRTATPMQAALTEMEGKTYQPEKLIQPDDVASVVVHALSLPRTAEVMSIHIRPAVNPGSGT